MNSRFAEHITNEDIRDLPLIAFDGDIHVLKTVQECDKALKELKQHQIIGFDTEKKPTFNKGEYNHTAMVQLATQSDAYLFRLNVMGYPKSLFDFMSNPEILKLGISIDDDLKDLNKARAFSPNNFVDLNGLAKDLGIKHIGVKKLAAIILESRISKNQQVSNWEAKTLSEAQLKYAATDAWVCLEIYDCLMKKGYI